MITTSEIFLLGSFIGMFLFVVIGYIILEIHDKTKQDEPYIVVNNFKYTPVYKENVIDCYYCSLCDKEGNCKLKHTGIKCEIGTHFVKSKLN